VLTQAIGALLPSAVAVALSPIPIVAVVVVLGTPRARTNGPAFAVGWVLGLAVVSTVVILTLGTASSSDGAASTAADALKAVLGLLLLVLAARKWRSRPRPGEEPELPKWLATVDALTPPKAFALGATLSGVNPKNLALTVAAAASIAQSGLGPGDEVLAIVVFVVLGSVTVAGAVVAAMVAPRRTAAPLASIQSFMSANNAVIMMVILVVFGAKLLGEGIGGLTA
jgi:threonine/homoserine/homoserine lactone efflux protein